MYPCCNDVGMLLVLHNNCSRGELPHSALRLWVEAMHPCCDMKMISDLSGSGTYCV